MNDTIGYATYQQQYNSTSSSTSYQTNDTISIVLFFSIIALLLLSFVLYFWYTERHKIPIDQRGDQAVGQQQEIYLLVDNISSQVKTTFKIPIFTLILVLWKKYTGKTATVMESTATVAALDRNPHINATTAAINTNTTAPLATTTTTTTPLILHEHQRVYHSKLYHLFSLLFIVSFVIALSILIGAVNSTIDDHSSTLLLQAALFVFVLSINLYLITRQRCYYMERRKLFGENDAHINAIYDTRFSNWDKSMWSNWVQITILIIEFFQLMTFPLRDLITVTSLVSEDESNTRQTETSQLISFVLNAGGLMPDMRTPTWYTYSLWTAFTVTCVSLILGLIIHAVNYKYPYKLPTRWVRWCIPVATLLYIPILTTFVSSAACQSLNIPTNDFSVTLRCNAPSISRQLYLWLSLFGYIIAYFLMTIFLTSYERAPTKNEIAYKSIGVAFIKNMGLLLAIVFLLVESTTNVNRMRAILSIAILLTMICYNIKTRPCYVDKVNFFRTASFTCILWTSALVAILSDTNAAQSLGPLTVIYIIIGGWIFIILCFVTVYFIYYIQPPDHEILSNSLNATIVDLSSKYDSTNYCERNDIERSDQQETVTLDENPRDGILSRWFSWTSTATNKEANVTNRYY
ncbi:Protein ccc1 [Mucor velutinosus]|uniref:Protein ccc1 n=1 Tax=Mucor velutinosus TaxID=708070 RepID=A0AAN7DFX0_9FUNG|nr:Protein ccc1 [Mucor velutinosus]